MKMMKEDRSVMSAKIQLEKLSLKELRELASHVEAAIKVRQESERSELKRKIEALAEDSGFSVSQLFGGRGGRKGSTVPVKYQNPKNPSETWTGRGRKPRWLSEKIDQGARMESFLIK